MHAATVGTSYGLSSGVGASKQRPRTGPGGFRVRGLAVPAAAPRKASSGLAGLRRLRVSAAHGWAETTDYRDPSARREDDIGRTPLDQLKVGQVVAGEIAAINLYRGAFIDVGCQYDGCARIKEGDWYNLRDKLHVNDRVIVQITAVRDPYRYRLPLELKLLVPDISSDLEEDYNDEFPNIIIHSGESVADVAAEVSRPLRTRARRVTIDEAIRKDIWQITNGIMEDEDVEDDDDVVPMRSDPERSAARQADKVEYERGMMQRVYSAADMTGDDEEVLVETAEEDVDDEDDEDVLIDDDLEDAAS
eukprot:jgi/Chlat1/1295/Chrsp118S01734